MNFIKGVIRVCPELGTSSDLKTRLDSCKGSRPLCRRSSRVTVKYINLFFFQDTDGLVAWGTRYSGVYFNRVISVVTPGALHTWTLGFSSFYSLSSLSKFPSIGVCTVTSSRPR